MIIKFNGYDIIATIDEVRALLTDAAPEKVIVQAPEMDPEPEPKKTNKKIPLTKKQKIKVFFKDGKCDIIPQKFWDDYEYNYGLFVVKKKGEWIGVYNMDCVACVVVG